MPPDKYLRTLHILSALIFSNEKKIGSISAVASKSIKTIWKEKQKTLKLEKFQLNKICWRFDISLILKILSNRKRGHSNNTWQFGSPSWIQSYQTFFIVKRRFFPFLLLSLSVCSMRKYCLYFEMAKLKIGKNKEINVW